MSTRNRLILRYVVTIVALFLLARLVDLNAFTSSLAASDPELLALGGLVLLAAFVLTTWKWSWLIRAGRVDVPTSRLLRLNIAAAFYAIILPGQLAGEAVKLARILRSPRDRAVLAASVVLDRVTGLLGILLLGLAGTLMGVDGGRAQDTVLVGLALSLVGVGIALGASRWLGTRTDPSGRFRSAGIKLARATSLIASDWYRSVAAIVGSIGYQSLLTLNAVIWAAALGIDVAFWTMAWMFAVVSVVQMLPLSIGGIGLREGSLVVLLGEIGIPAHDAVALGVLMFIGNLAIAVVGGLLEIVPDRSTETVELPRS